MLARIGIFVGAILIAISSAHSAIPLVINHQGSVFVNGSPYGGVGGQNGLFKFGFVDASGEWLWTHDGTNLGLDASSNIPSSNLLITVRVGQYSVILGGDESTNQTAGNSAIGASMAPITSSVFEAPEVYLRVIFNDGEGNGERVLAPDQLITSTAFAFHASQSDTTPNFIDGGQIARSGNNSLTIQPLICRDDTNKFNITVDSALEKHINIVFAQGDDAGAWVGDVLTVPSIADIVYIWAIGDSSGVNPGDYIFSLTSTTPTLPSGYDVKRLIGGRPWKGSEFAVSITIGSGRDRWVFLNEPLAIYTNSNVANATPIIVDASNQIPYTTSLIQAAYSMSVGMGSTATHTFFDAGNSLQGITEEVASTAAIQSANRDLFRVSAGSAYTFAVNVANLSGSISVEHRLIAYLENL